MLLKNFAFSIILSVSDIFSSIGGYSNPRTYVKEKPGVSPLMPTNFLLENTIFMKLSDVTTELPPYREDVVQVQIDAMRQKQYENFEK
ncbi:hypothetical protein ACMCNP_04950 [Candidatus Acidulodesulfobacterium sp. H_13]|uniref:hypothetical protein n=1 Tax=Candidatus Acidulodesulfobacterium sp. H_13 TaxID=3395470 RepID=UPI003AF767CA